MDQEAKIKELEEELSKTKYNKKTQHHVGLVKAKIAHLKADQIKEASKKGKGSGYAVKKTGDATIALLGYPSVGKSTILNHITNADSEVGYYDFTTLDVIPGMLLFDGSNIQVLDIPGIIQGAARGAGRGKEVMAIIRSSELVIIVLDPKNYDKLQIIRNELYEAGIRVNQRIPDVKIVKKAKGGIDIGATYRLSKLDEQTIKDVLREFGLVNASIVIRNDIDVDELIDTIEGNRKYIEAIVVMNKSDLIKDFKQYKGIDIFISGEKNQNLEALKKMIFDRLGLLRIYMREPGKEADMKDPLIIKKDSTVLEVCNKLHRDFSKHFRFARIWGSAKFPGQKQGLTYKLKDKDIVQLFID